METNISSGSGHVCPRCGFSKPVEARFCANCGKTFIPARSFFVDMFKNIIGSKTTLILFSCLALLIIYAWTKYLIVWNLFYPISYIILAISVGAFSVIFGWRMAMSPSNHRRLSLVLVFTIIIKPFIQETFSTTFLAPDPLTIRLALRDISRRSSLFIIKSPTIFATLPSSTKEGGPMLITTPRS